MFSGSWLVGLDEKSVIRVSSRQQSIDIKPKKDYHSIMLAEIIRIDWTSLVRSRAQSFTQKLKRHTESTVEKKVERTEEEEKNY